MLPIEIPVPRTMPGTQKAFDESINQINEYLLRYWELVYKSFSLKEIPPSRSPKNPHISGSAEVGVPWIDRWVYDI